MSKKTVWILAGTTEGRLLIKYLSDKNVDIFASVATSYGAALLGEQSNLRVHVGALNASQMQKQLQKLKPCLVIDATHPYATKVSANMRAACKTKKVEYQRVARASGNLHNCLVVENFSEAVELLAHTTGHIFLTTGSKDLAYFTQLKDFSSRIFLRILPMTASLEKALTLGFRRQQIICMQGPFNQALNSALFKAAKARFVVTKDSGQAGGFTAKKKAAKQVGAQVIVIKRTKEETGNNLSVIKEKITKLLAK